MSLRLLVDEDTQRKSLVCLLRDAGHHVVTVNELELRGSDDTVVFDCAKRQGRIVLTQNCTDFKALHQRKSSHPGILAIYQYNDPSKEMSRKDIVKAISNIETAGSPVANQFTSLNFWNY